MNKNFYRLLGVTFVFVFTAYALASSILLFKNGSLNALVNGCMVLGLWLFICLIPLSLVLGKLNGFLARVERLYDDEEPHEEKQPKPTDYTVKKVLPWFFLLLLIAVGLIIYASILVSKMTGDGFMRCKAEATDYGYKFYDLSGATHLTEDGASWGGVNFRGGKPVTIYYELSNPENVIFPSNVIMLFVGGWFFLMGSLIALSSLFKRYQDIAPIFAGLMFAGLSIGVQAGIALAGGMNIMQTVLSGGTAYIMNVFLALGAYTFLFGLYKTFRPKRRHAVDNN